MCGYFIQNNISIGLKQEHYVVISVVSSIQNDVGIGLEEDHSVVARRVVISIQNIVCIGLFSFKMMFSSL